MAKKETEPVSQYADTKYKLQEAGTGMVLVGLLGLMLYLSVNSPMYPMGIVIIGLMTFAVGRLIR